MKTLKLLTTIALAGAVAFMSSSVFAKERTKGRGAGGPVVYVSSQELFYDTIVLGPLPYNGTDNFQLLETMGGPVPPGLHTEFGPGDTDYYGGRWWVDGNGNGYMDDQDGYFLCPLLGPGRTDP